MIKHVWVICSDCKGKGVIAEVEHKTNERVIVVCDRCGGHGTRLAVLRRSQSSEQTMEAEK